MLEQLIFEETLWYEVVLNVPIGVNVSVWLSLCGPAIDFRR